MANKRVKNITLPAIGGPFTVDVANPADIVHVDTTAGAAITLSSAANITATGTAQENTYITFIFDGNVTSDTSTGKVVTIFGVALTDAQALYEGEITAFYDNSVWEIRIFPDAQSGVKNFNGAVIATGTVSTDALASLAVTNAKLDNLTRGYIKVGGTSDIISDLNAKTDGYIVVGNGTDLNSVAVSGDVGLSNTGLATIQPGSVDAEMLSFTLASTLTATLTISAAQMIELNSVPLTVIAAPGDTKIISVTKASLYLDYNTAAYAGGSSVQLVYSAAPTISVWSSPSASVTGTVDTFSQMAISSTQLVAFRNNSLMVTNLTSNFTTGDSPVTVFVEYTILDIA